MIKHLLSDYLILQYPFIESAFYGSILIATPYEQVLELDTELETDVSDRLIRLSLALFVHEYCKVLSLLSCGIN